MSSVFYSKKKYRQPQFPYLPFKEGMLDYLKLQRFNINLTIP
ncbi:Uncharacterized protein dnl_59820 [Desulfonema limicola]|uniref:Uncharacterized protein n=1 Tax=Desulfonema limicola TaxID=45656 RepID=A0A975BDC4_9BACT|nr:Uncharacterized protein dnl_59820 [Desulfonema limicola]